MPALSLISRMKLYYEYVAYLVDVTDLRPRERALSLLGVPSEEALKVSRLHPMFPARSVSRMHLLVPRCQGTPVVRRERDTVRERCTLSVIII
jgi:hypothetical protein